MAIQKTPGDIVMDPDDVVFTHRGITWGLKFREYSSDWRPIFIVVKDATNKWSVSANITEDFDYGLIQSGMTLEEWIEKVFFVKLNAWLASMFPAGTTTIPAPEGDKFVKLFGMIKTMKVQAKADGTVVASLV